MNTNEEIHSIAKEIMKQVMRRAAQEYSFLERAIYMLVPAETDKTTSLCADYRHIYYNSDYVTGTYKKGAAGMKKLVKSVVHCVLHCLYLHPSLTADNHKLYDAAADFVILKLMADGNMLNYSDTLRVLETAQKFPSMKTSDIYLSSAKDKQLERKLLSVTSKHDFDDHSIWYTDKSADADNTEDNAESLSARRDGTEDEEEWSRQLENCIFLCGKGMSEYGSGNMFGIKEKPRRFSRFSFKEYIRRFAQSEMISEDPETLDLMSYCVGMELYGDMPFVEYSETKEYGTPSDIIIAIDMSGSCSGDIASNFLRQIYTLFSEMDIKGSVRLRVVFFDTIILNEAEINSAKDADNFIKNYEMMGFGGTDFCCVFDYANKYKEHSGGRSLKGLFFFSDGMGRFPNSAPEYKTVFFIPNSMEEMFSHEEYLPVWAEAVRYNDD